MNKLDQLNTIEFKANLTILLLFTVKEVLLLLSLMSDGRMYIITII